MVKTEIIKKALENHNLYEIVKMFFNAKNGGKIDTIQKWVDVIKYATKQKDYNGKNKWANKIANGDWATNKYGKKIYFKFGSDDKPLEFQTL